MGQKHSELKVRAKLTVHGGDCVVDGLRLSYNRKSCWCKGRRVVAAFTFPEDGWLQVSSEDIRQNKSTKGVNVPLKALRKKDGNISVSITCLAGKVPVYRTQLALGDLLDALLLTKRGNEALLFFNLTGGTVQGGAFTALFCNGRRCGDTAREEAPNQRPSDGKMEAEDDQGQDGSPIIAEHGQEIAEDTPCLSEDDQGLEGRPSPTEDDQILEGSPGLEDEHQGHDVVPNQEEQTPQWHGGHCDEDVPPFLDSHDTSSHGGQCHGRFNIIEAIGIHLGVLACCLVFFNAWREWMES